MIGLMTGSVNVITLNINRIVQDWWKTVNTATFSNRVTVTAVNPD